MNVSEWPVTLFTVLTQLSVGAFIALGFINVMGRRYSSARVIDRVSYPALYAIGPIMVLALVGSMFHMGNPFNSLNVIRHVGSSWLSLEIVFGVGFAGLGFAFAFVQWMGWFSPLLRNVLASFTALWGLAFIFVTANVYLLPTVPAWNHWTTVAQFFLTAFITGPLAVAVALAAYPWIRRSRTLSRWMSRQPVDFDSALETRVDRLITRCLRWVGVAAVTLLPVELVVILFNFMRGTGVNPPEHAFQMGWFVTRIVLIVVGAGLMGLYLTRLPDSPADAGVRSRSNRRVLTLVATSFTLVLVAEFIGRFMFYGANDRIGI
ncbi:dimethyl sulfoxide reductase anchor subunit family protein [Gleimia hominis]|uniref:dimethyl sulfoxide reductase anchor subunit family protein n=1 Tax=Gleimia hominis TaxID=595468 RepID=UPI000C80B260|nr:DmsC/YnfH family molybdoenzyme membrane anchor subunit [Gleimia hominis]WIK64800.1 dimethyl sulfoxide reductase anchor subunit [Gleimia hominis]